ncbi:hypothetical protein ACFFV7_39630 [Nonomuraea spiralis]|uniref:Uncharacterized protein n=1 Tax=Nonomuraea spiralis TaxID=46182 RepID=A0ABV5IS26_9ACTN|nr:hypothetical protein [Nonomuraea spiralis]GGT44919.1 hypothetical protein GCM10010176_105310 [Nonomuraea spiralis]
MALVHAAYAAGDLTTEQATQMIAALAGREETTAEYGWRVDLVLAGLVTCGGCGADLTPDMTAGVVTDACPADGCGLVRVAARVLVPAVAQRVLEPLRTAAAPDLLLALAHRRGSELVPPDKTSMEIWWASADPDTQKELLALLLDHVVVKPADGPGFDVAARLSMAWRSA